MNFRELDRTWIVAEIGANHEGDFEIAKDLVRMAAQAGADAVKFQTYAACRYISAAQPERRNAAAGRELSSEQFREIADFASECGLTFFSTPLSLEDTDGLDGFVSLFKVASGEITWLDLIRHIASKGKPMIVSTGGATVEEIGAAVDAVLSVRPDASDLGHLMLMHCVMAYPAPDDSANLANIAMLGREFGLPVGYSDHTLGIKACELAVTAGAVSLEKHFTYRKENQTFRDHQLSADPAEMKALVAAVRNAERLRGGAERRLQPAEAEILDTMRRSVAAAVDIPAAVPIKREWLTALRPMWGVPAENIDTVIGRMPARAIAAGELIREEDLTS